VCVFTRTLSDDLASLVKQIDAEVEKNESQKMAAFVVLLSDHPDTEDAKLKALAKDHKIENVPLTVFRDSKGPENYKISPEAEVTVLMWRERSVKVNHAFAKGKFDKNAVKRVVAETPKILNEP